MATDAQPRVFVQPGAPPALREVVHAGDGEIVGNPYHANVILWARMESDGLREALHDGIQWVQLPAAGVDRWLRDGILDDRRAWTSAAGAYAKPVAEHAMAMLLAACRRLHEPFSPDDWGRRWQHAGSSLAGATVAIVGCGGIGERLLAMLAPFGACTIAVTRTGRTVATATRSVAAQDLPRVWPVADYIVLLAPSTDATAQMVSHRQLGLMKSTAWLLNVARGPLVDTDALVEALDAGAIAGAALDVTDPEPLPAGHPLWRHPRSIITPHVACPPDAMISMYRDRILENLRRFRQGQQLLGLVDVERGY